VRTKVFRVHLAGGLAVDVLTPVGSVIDLSFIVERAQALAARYFALTYRPLPALINAAQTLPGDVAYVVEPRPPAKKIMKKGVARRSRL
jgi:hypothetical protein